jgi:ABC-type nickel/cobalt efflux system permease component RcnA
MNPRTRAIVQISVLVVVIGILVLMFPSAYGFVERAARELRYFWWLILLIALGAWLIWGFGRKTKQ